jgi:hypothetical protein
MTAMASHCDAGRQPPLSDTARIAWPEQLAVLVLREVAGRLR